MISDRSVRACQAKEKLVEDIKEEFHEEDDLLDHDMYMETVMENARSIFDKISPRSSKEVIS